MFWEARGTEESKEWSRLSAVGPEWGREDCLRRGRLIGRKWKRVRARRCMNLKNSSAQSEDLRGWRLGRCVRKWTVVIQGLCWQGPRCGRVCRWLRRPKVTVMKAFGGWSIGINHPHGSWNLPGWWQELWRGSQVPEPSVSVGKWVRGWRDKGKAGWKPPKPGGSSSEGQEPLHEGGRWKE